MGDDDYQQSYTGQSNNSFASRASLMMEQTHQHCLDTMGTTQHYQTPLPMWHPAQSHQSNMAAMSMMPQTQSHHNNAAALSMMLQAQGLRYYQNPVKMFPQALQQTQSSQLYHATLACSKRFSEEEKQKLERVFTDETQKPSTGRKRQLAEELACPVPKVNNWFQNRRAREKQLHRVQAYEASRAADPAASEADVPDFHEDENDDAASSGPYSLSHGSQALQPSSAPLSDADDASDQHAPSPYLANGHDSEESAANSPATSPPKDGNRSYDNARDTGDEQSLQSHIQSHNMTNPFVSSNIPLISTSFEDRHGNLSSSPETYMDCQNQIPLHPLHDGLPSDYQFGEMAGMGNLSPNSQQAESFASSSSFMTQSTAAFAADIIGHEHMEDACSTGQGEVSRFSSFDSLSPDMIPQTSPTSDQADWTRSLVSPQATSIASRRKTRPPQRLNQIALRNYPNGPKTGIEGSKRSEIYGTIRRAASATGPLSGKIFKSGPPVSPLSPRSFDPNFLEQITRSSSLSVTRSGYQDTSSTSPIGPNFEQRYLSADTQSLGIQRSSISSNGFGESLSVSPSTPDYTPEITINGAQAPGFQHFRNPTFTVDTGYTGSSDEALATPGLSQVGSELEFSTSLSAPRYVESEPATPSYVPVSAAAQGQAYLALKFESPPQTDVLPWSRSPDQLSVWHGSMGHFGESQSRAFQFQPNITPQNFHSPTQG